MHIAAVQTERLADPQTGTGQQHDQEAVPRSQGDGDHVADLLVAEVFVTRLSDPEPERGRLCLSPLAELAVS